MSLNEIVLTKKYYNTAEAALILGLGQTATVRKYIKKRLLRACKIDNEWVIEVNALAEKLIRQGKAVVIKLD